MIPVVLELVLGASEETDEGASEQQEDDCKDTQELL
jgi:hypothetical protein